MNSSTRLPAGPGRIDVLDAVRGAAILGILIANIRGFSTPSTSIELRGILGAHDEAGRSLGDGLLTALVAGKFRGILAILFGLGMSLQVRKRRDSGGSWPGSYARRTILLMVIGAVHGILIWHGDILFAYGLTAVVMMVAAESSSRFLKGLVAGAMGASLLLALGSLGGANSSDAVPSLLRQHPELSLWLTPKGEAAAYSEGSLGLQVMHRAGWFPVNLILNLFLLPYYCGLFGMGLLLGRSEAWAEPARMKAAIRKGLVFGIGVGLPLNLLAIPLTMAGQGQAAAAVVGVLFSALLSLGYMALAALVGLHGKFLAGLLAAVGRNALTSYVLTSILASFAYDSWGLRLFGRSSVQQDALVTIIIWLVLIAGSWLWNRRYALGPIEWIWRSATEKRWLPILNSSRSQEQRS